MSKSYGKYKSLGICTGSNTEWYRDRIRKIRNKNKHRIRNILTNYSINEFDDVYNPYSLPKKDTWMEPTDGTIRYDYKRIKKMMKENNLTFSLEMVSLQMMIKEALYERTHSILT